MRKTSMAFALLIVLIAPLCFAFAANAPRGSADRGRNYFRNTCKNCHTKGAVGREVTPIDKTLAQWREYFSRGRHADSTLRQVVKSDQDLRDVEAFLVSHAADSEQPEICGR